MIQYCSKMVWEIKHNIYFTLNFFNKGSDQGKLISLLINQNLIMLNYLKILTVLLSIYQTQNQILLTTK